MIVNDLFFFFVGISLILIFVCWLKLIFSIKNIFSINYWGEDSGVWILI